MADPLRTEEERKTVTQKILNLTLEIIYLITGEDYSVVAKTSGDHVTPLTYSYISGEWTRNESPIMDPPLYSLILEEKNTSKILEVINKITELLTAEVPIRCQDVTVYFSMEEWEYIEGHKDLYKDVMMENRPPLTSPDGFSNKSTPERCPHSPYSQDHHKIPQNDEDKGLIVIEVEEETYVKADDPCKEEDMSPEISTDTQHNWSNVDKQPITFPNDEVEEKKFTWESSEENPFTSDLHLISYSEDPSSDPSTHDTSFVDLSSPITHTTGDQSFPCPECGKCFNMRDSTLVIAHIHVLNVGKHTRTKPLFCHMQVPTDNKRCDVKDKLPCAHTGPCFH
ncbi:hypothetical protein AB205_0071560 [Aquarana catesbeiana]|uniref:KRAB domain-containing protein n=1 Tax=Aquarana catesbeiana TaxID=8400 RepID=A0A2G9S7T3_AQUCT|nr:hypothetical protein AB205_0071560 [Aquarana catesbeiana]PIO36229.1 hypothetical protein AB205_0071560 [Aquarana catesbeiana]